ncbi:MAG: ABC transporter permease [Candidatus Brocadiae bacterium]|nr:ABC transporter permease [Candidatus Brocadiia bacterium]
MPAHRKEPEKHSRPWFDLAAAALGSCILLFIIAPLLGLLLSSSSSELFGAITDEEVTRSIRLTLSAALLATAAGTATGVPLAYLLARKRFFGRAVLLAIIDLPIIIPHSAAGIALLTLIGRRSLLGSVLGSFVGTFQGIAVAMAFVSVPFLVNAARAGFAAVPERLEKAARTLGASPARVFFTISVPMAWRDILSGMILMWARGISEFGAVVIIAYHPMTTPVLVFQRFNDYGLAHARSAAVVLILICVAVFAVLRLVAGVRATEAAQVA